MATPKKQRKGSLDLPLNVSPTSGGTPSPNALAGPLWAPQQPTAPQLQPPSAPQEAGASHDPALGASRPAGEAVTDAAVAFRELRVRAQRAPSPRRPGGGGGEGAHHAGAGGGAPERPSSPKKRKASTTIDKEYILKDDKVKRNADTQGDISQARGQLGQLLFEFSQIELNRDLLEAIKRTESKTGRSSGRPPVRPGRLDRAAFELAVSDAAELLQAQLSSVEAHCEDAALRGAILRTYAVQAIAAFADEDSESEDESGAGAGGAGVSSSSDDENADRNSRRQLRGGSGSQEGPSRVAGSGDTGGTATGSQSLDMLPRPGSAAGCHSPPHVPAHLQHEQQQQLAGGAAGQGPGPGGAGLQSSPPRSMQPAGSAAGQEASSSFLPDAPPDSALEDTATAGGPHDQQAAQQQQQQPFMQREGSSTAAGGTGPFAASRFAWQRHMVERAADEGLQRMRMLSLEAEGSAQQQSLEEGEGDENGQQDMVLSPAPVTSRRLPPPPPASALAEAGLPLRMQSVRMAEGQAETEAGQPVASVQQHLQLHQQQGQPGAGMAGGAAPSGAPAAAGPSGKRAAPAAALGGRAAALLEGDAPRVSLGTRTREQQKHKQQQAGAAGAGGEEQQQESSDGHSTGQASSAARAEPPKRQRRSGDLLPPVLEHSQPQRPRREQQQAPGVAAAATAGEQQAGSCSAAAAAAAAQRAAILGSVRPRDPAAADQPELSPAGPPAGGAAGAGGPAQPQLRRGGSAPEGSLAAAAAAGGGGEGGNAPAGEPSDATLRGAARAAHSGSSVWGSTLVCADLTLNDVASQYWPFLRSAMRGQSATLQPGDKALVSRLVSALGDTIADAYVAQAGAGQRPAAEVKSLVAATAFDDFFRAQNVGESSGASGQ